MNALSVQGLVKSFGGIRATDNLDLDIHVGEIHAIIGPNGAGKTTLINQLSGELMPNSGSIHFGDVDVTREPCTVAFVSELRAAIRSRRSFRASPLCKT